MQKLFEVQVSWSEIQLFYDRDKIICVKHPSGAKIMKTSTIMIDREDVMDFVDAFKLLYEKKPDYYRNTCISFNNLADIYIKTNKPESVVCCTYLSYGPGEVRYFVFDKRVMEIKTKDCLQVLGPYYASFRSLTKAKIFMACLAELEM